MMEKIQDLLKQLGATEELSKALVTELHAYKKGVQDQLQEEFKSRLQKAKQICLEEFEAEKVKMARKVEVFLESRISTIDREAQRQAAIGESEATKTLRELKHLLEGVPMDGNSKDIQAVKEETKQLRVRLNQVLEEKETIKAQVSRSNEIAMKALERNKILESKLRGGTVTESKETPTEISELKTKSQTPQTTRKILAESQVRIKPEANQGDPEVLQIASQIDNSPAYLDK